MKSEHIYRVVREVKGIIARAVNPRLGYTESQIALTAMTEDAKEGLKAFAEKRRPSR